MRRNFPLILLCMLSAMAVIVAGNMYWNKKKGDFFRRLYSRQSFTLLDGDGKFFNTRDISKNKKVLFVFIPDSIPVSAVKPFRILLGELSKKETDVIVVSGIHEDVVKNFLRAAGFRGRLLLDPSQSLARYLGARESMDPVFDWALVMSDRDLVVSWSVAKKEVPELKDLREKL